MMERVTGIGGIFFKARNPADLMAWYREHLGIDARDGYFSFPWRELNEPERMARTVWAPFPEDSSYFKPSAAPFMINYRVANLDCLLEQLRCAGVAIESQTEDENGRFAWVMDPEGNRIELWEPPPADRSPGDGKRAFLRHSVATLAYRASKTLGGAPQGFATVRVCDTTRSAVEILAHLGDLLEWALSMARGQPGWKATALQSWEAEVERFFEGLRRLDDFLAADTPLGCPAEKLFQGPIADALTHTGQLATLRRLAGAPVAGENYFKAEVVLGRVGPEQAPPRFEFE